MKKKSGANLLRSCGIGVVLLGASMVPLGAATIDYGTPSPGTAIGLGSSQLEEIVISTATSFTEDFYFTLTGAGLFSANAIEGTSAGGNSINPFTMTLFDSSIPSSLATNSTPTVNGSTESIQLSDVQPLNTTDVYELVVSGTTLSGDPFPIAIDGNVTISPSPLPSTWTMLIASLLGLGLFAYRGSKKRSCGVSMLDASTVA